ncbi:MAG: hypothetical protein M0R51_09305, partial [Clostridia bacterium]|nr:hypothetical protein [Clostridia bacterium]
MNFVKTLGILLSIALLCSAASAATENKDLPTQSEVSTFVGGLAPTGNYADSVSTAATAQHPTWKWDIWTDAAGSQMISFYYSENSAKGYGSMYYNELGQVSGCTGSYTLVKSYTGEAVQDATVTETKPIDISTEALVVETVTEAIV